MLCWRWGMRGGLWSSLGSRKVCRDSRAGERCELMRVVCAELKSKHRLFFSPFPELSVISSRATHTADALVAGIEAHIAHGHYAQAETDSKALAALALRGIEFYDTFDQTRLKWIVTTGYVSFALYTLIYTIETYGTTTKSTSLGERPSRALDTAVALLAAVVVTIFVLEKTPWYCLYASFPVYFGRSLLQYALGKSSVFRCNGKNAKDVAVSLSGVAATLGVLFAIAVS